MTRTWMDMTPSDWLEMAYGDVLRTPASELMGNVYYARPRAGGGPTWTMPAPPPFPVPPPMRGPRWGGRLRFQRDQRHQHGCGCGCHDAPCPRCNDDPCQCACCIGDVDFAVYTRVGEQRVIPIVVENERRRDKDIKVELSTWSTRSGKPAPVETLDLDPREFTLGPCEQRKLTLIVRVRADDEKNQAGQANRKEGERQLPDVDDCVVAIADLRLEGCDHRPIRIALAILPRDCDPYTVTCGCGCC